MNIDLERVPSFFPTGLVRLWRVVGLVQRAKCFVFNMVRKGGLEPPRSCDRQPLKLVRLPIPPLSLDENHCPERDHRLLSSGTVNELYGRRAAPKTKHGTPATALRREAGARNALSRSLPACTVQRKLIVRTVRGAHAVRRTQGGDRLVRRTRLDTAPERSRVVQGGRIGGRARPPPPTVPRRWLAQRPRGRRA